MSHEFSSHLKFCTRPTSRIALQLDAHDVVACARDVHDGVDLLKRDTALHNVIQCRRDTQVGEPLERTTRSAE